MNLQKTVSNALHRFLPMFSAIVAATATTPTVSAAELLVADRATNRILSFDEATGEFLRVVTDTGLDEPSGMTFGPGGFLYVSNVQGTPAPESAASVVRVDPVDGTTTDFTSDVIAPGGIAYHQESDTLFVSEFGGADGDEVFRFDSSGNLLQTLGTGSAPTGRSGIAFDAAGNLYVSEFVFAQSPEQVGSVLKYAAPTGDPTDAFDAVGSEFASGGGITLPASPFTAGFNGLTFDDSGDLFVASLLGQGIIKFDVESGSVAGGAAFGAPIAFPAGLSVGADGNLLATSLGNDNPMTGPLFPGNVQVFNSLFTGSYQLLRGDLDGDALVGAGDLAAWGAEYAAGFGGDLDGDFDTDGADFLIWQQNVGHQGLSGDFQPTAIVRYEPPPAVNTIPEPAAFALALMVAARCLLSRKRV